MDTHYESITKEQLCALLTHITPELKRQGHQDFVKLWKDFIESYANDDMHFFNSNRGNYKEYFPLESRIYDMKYSILFDVDRILRNIEQHRILPDEHNYFEMKNDFYFTKPDNMDIICKTIPPVLVYFPAFQDSVFRQYAVIDGNHRIYDLIKKDHDFKLHIISPFDLRLECFLNINSWIAYHLISGSHYAVDRTKQEFLKYTEDLQLFLQVIKRTLIPYHDR